MNKIPMTTQGVEKLRLELDNLKGVERPRIINAISEAREHGDLKENAEYHAAKEQQGFVEGRIAEIESKLSHAQVIDVSKLNQDGRVVFGVTVELLNCNDDSSHEYQIVGDDEADFKAGKISINSPLARAMIGKEVDDVFVVSAPGGEVEYEITQIRYC